MKHLMRKWNYSVYGTQEGRNNAEILHLA